MTSEPYSYLGVSFILVHSLLQSLAAACYHMQQRSENILFLLTSTVYMILVFLLQIQTYTQASKWAHEIQTKIGVGVSKETEKHTNTHIPREARELKLCNESPSTQTNASISTTFTLNYVLEGLVTISITP